MHLCMDYRDLNRITIKGKYPLSVIEDLVDQQDGANYFMKIDPSSCHHQIRIALEDIEKIAFRTRYGGYKWLVLSFGLTSAPGTFSCLGNELLREFFGDFEIVYMDDLVVYSRTLHDQMEHIRGEVLAILRKHKL